MIRSTDFTHPNSSDDVPSQVFMMPWPRKPLSAPPKGKGPPQGPKPSRSGLHKLKRITHPDPYF